MLEGIIPSYDSEKPTRENENGVIYSFNGYDKEIIPVKEDMILKIKWEPNQYKITKENGSEVEESLVYYNNLVVWGYIINS